MDSMISLTIDNREVEVKRGASVLEAAQSVGVYIPTLCYHPSLEPFGACRLCVVEIEKMRGFPTSCTTPVAEGMVVHTDTPQLQQLRRSILELILTEHPQTCLTCPKNLNCELQRVAQYIGLNEISLPQLYKELPVKEDNPFFYRDYNLCILCGRCVRVCQEIRGVGAVAFTYRGSQALIGTAFDLPLLQAGCQFCGACIDVCPTGALIERSRRGWQALPERSVLTTCPYCGVGCQLRLEIKKGRIIGVTPELEAVVNQGQACVKGRFGIAEPIHHPDRLTTPLVRRNGKLEEATWEEAISQVAQRFTEIKERYGPDSLGAFSSSRCTNEENYLVQKLARTCFGTNNVDNCARI